MNILDKLMNKNIFYLIDDVQFKIKNKQIKFDMYDSFYLIKKIKTELNEIKYLLYDPERRIEITISSESFEKNLISSYEYNKINKDKFLKSLIFNKRKE